ncbi:hypothetical protein Q763_13695 [Flavobacterium beibuense F44-8]|uniref:Gliding motility protein GldH n=1 Tax=Flavobacterium beibuense F44-8 TaxID=1406840 RepID=A0A0A2LJJ3_9FLAO|nr:hypothetical protein [Flavobacterium beibuense]KGO79421.1 hypothetical protein Q763_13695 [Flavobacterium beibuense F44-8]
MKKLFLLLSLLILTSCTQFGIFSETIKDFDNNRWEKNDTKSFSFQINEDVDKANLEILFSHVHEPGYDKVPVEITFKKADGSEEIIKTDLLLTDGNGKSYSECIGDVCDLEQTVKENFTLAKGDYTITISNTTNLPYLPNVIALGIGVETAE